MSSKGRGAIFDMDNAALKRLRKMARIVDECARNALLASIEMTRCALDIRELASPPTPCLVLDRRTFSVYHPGPPKVLRIVAAGNAPSFNTSYKKVSGFHQKVKISLREYWRRQLEGALAHRYGPAVEPFDTAFAVGSFYFSDGRSRDPDNYWDKSIFDILQRLGVLRSDSSGTVRSIFLTLGRAPEGRTEIVLTDSAQVYLALVTQSLALAAGDPGVIGLLRDGIGLPDLEPYIPISGNEDGDLPF